MMKLIVLNDSIGGHIHIIRDVCFFLNPPLPSYEVATPLFPVGVLLLAFKCKDFGLATLAVCYLARVGRVGGSPPSHTMDGWMDDGLGHNVNQRVYIMIARRDDISSER
jgi:hypothetical protein